MRHWSLDVSPLITSIPMSTVLEVINKLFTEHIEDPEVRHRYGKSFTANTDGLEKDSHHLLQISKTVCPSSMTSSTNSYTAQLWVLVVPQ